jgi:hypothetical protein
LLISYLFIPLSRVSQLQCLIVGYRLNLLLLLTWFHLLPLTEPDFEPRWLLK